MSLIIGGIDYEKMAELECPALEPGDVHIIHRGVLQGMLEVALLEAEMEGAV